jgi:hypothetical protein
MANKKISQLTSAGPLLGSEQLPIVQSGTTVKTTLDDVLSYSISSSIVDVTSINDLITFTKGDGTTTDITVLTTSSFNAFTSSIVTTSSFNAFTSSVVTTSSFGSFTSSYSTGSFTGSFNGSLTGLATSASYAVTSSTLNTYRYYAKLISNALVVGLVTGSSRINEMGDGSGDGVNDISWSMGASGVITGSMTTGNPFIGSKLLVTMAPSYTVGNKIAVFLPEISDLTVDSTKLYIFPRNAANAQLLSASSDYWTSIVEIKKFN